MADTGGGGGGGMRRLVLAEISLSLPHILPIAFLLLLPVMGSNAQKIRHLTGGPGFVYLLRFMVEGRFRCLCNNLCTSE